jgi:hypothetical protein
VTDAALDLLRFENRRHRAEKAMRQQIENRRRQAEKAMRQQIGYREVLPTQRPNGLTPKSSPWFIDRRGWWCRLLSADLQIVADYVVMMEAQSQVPDTTPLTPAPDAPMLPPSAVHKERSCDTKRATGGSKSGSPLD